MVIDLEFIAPFVIVITRVKRLVHIADEMYQEFQGFVAFEVTAFFITENRKILIDRADYAIAICTVAGTKSAALAPRDRVERWADVA